MNTEQAFDIASRGASMILSNNNIPFVIVAQVGEDANGSNLAVASNMSSEGIKLMLAEVVELAAKGELADTNAERTPLTDLLTGKPN